MKKLFEKYETVSCILLIVLYIVINSFCMQNFGLQDYRSTIINTCFSLGLMALMLALGRSSYYGLKKPHDSKRYLYFLPLLLIVSVNLWNGVNIADSADKIIFYMLSMINVGFIEEIIFRGFLFRMMEKDNAKVAIIVSSITFGIGHIINLFNGADLIPTLMQICYAMAAGYLFVIIFYRSGSLVPCILAHSAINSLSVFNVENTVSLYIAPVFLTIIPLVYAFYINKVTKDFKREDIDKTI